MPNLERLAWTVGGEMMYGMRSNVVILSSVADGLQKFFWCGCNGFIFWKAATHTVLRVLMGGQLAS